MESPAALLQLAALRFDVISMDVKCIPSSTPMPKFHFVPRASTVSRRLHCSPGGFLRTDLHLSTTNLVPTRIRLAPTSSHILICSMSLAALTSRSRIIAKTGSTIRHKGETCEVQTNYSKGVPPSNRTVNLVSPNPA